MNTPAYTPASVKLSAPSFDVPQPLPPQKLLPFPNGQLQLTGAGHGVFQNTALPGPRFYAPGQLYGSGVVLPGPAVYKDSPHVGLGLPLTVFGPSMLSAPGPVKVLAPLQPPPKLALVNNVASVKQEVKVAPVLSSGFKPILPATLPHGPHGQALAIGPAHTGYGGAAQGKSYYQQPYQLDLLHASGHGQNVGYTVQQVSPGHICPGFHAQHQIGQVVSGPQHGHVVSKVQFDDVVVAQQVLPLVKQGPNRRPPAAYSPDSIRESAPSLGIPREKIANAGVVYSKAQKKRLGGRPSSYGGPSQLLAEEYSAGGPLPHLEVGIY